VDESRILGRGGRCFNVGGNCSGQDIGGHGGGGVKRWRRVGERDHPQASAGAFVGTQNRASTIGNGAANFREVNIAAGIAERDDRKQGVGRQVRDDVGMARGGWEHGNVQRARVGGRHTRTVGESRDDGLGGWGDVGRGRS